MSTEAERRYKREWARRARKDPIAMARMRVNKARYNAKHKEKVRAGSRAWKKKNKSRVSRYRKAYYLSHKVESAAYSRALREKDPEAFKRRKVEIDRRYRKKNAVALKAKRSTQSAKQIKNRRERLRCFADVPYRLGKRLRFLLWQALKAQGVKKIYSIDRLVGCTLLELKAHIEKQFKTGMSWRKRNFHIDHMKPCAAFDLSDPKQQKICFHYTNLQPLWPKDNISKGSRWMG